MGHHRDDIVETLFLNMFHQSKLKAMPPKLLSDDKKNIIIQDDSENVQDDSENVQDGKKTTVIPTERSDEGPPSGYSYLLRSDLVEILHCVQDELCLKSTNQAGFSA